MVKNVERILLALLVVVSILNLIFANELAGGLAIISLLVLICGFHHLSSAFKWATGIFFVLGLLIAGFNHFSLSVVVNAINSMDSLIVLLIVMQLFTIPIAVGRYQNSIVTLVNGKLPTNRSLFGFTMVITFLLSSILSMGTVPIIYSILGPTIKQRLGKDYNYFSSVAISRSFTLGTLWAPGAATIFLISTITHVSLQKLFVPSFVLGLLGLLLAWLIELYTSPVEGKKDNLSIKREHAGHALMQVLQIALAVAILLVIAFVLIDLKIGEAMIDVALAGLVVILIWLAALQVNDLHHQRTIKAGKEYLQNGLLRGGSLAPFFVAIGLFSNVFEHSQVSKTIAQTLTPYIVHLSWGALILIPLLVVLLSLVGVHPLASVTLLGQVMMGINLPFNALAIALGLNIGSVLAYMMSPFAGIVVVIANILGVSSATVSLKWNGKYCTGLFVLSLVFIIIYTLIFS
ncbi:hypothetical protein [uncultured Limosilactobacillus sp.]|uniref:hypothetical protein n=1 Tax=uncultured Limosilactobacillus sp. TaxID=2837629 RepID=UPI0025F7FEA2|nr:hypothetical protein [uncultured Limosilactobacillus sp.]